MALESTAQGILVRLIVLFELIMAKTGKIQYTKGFPLEKTPTRVFVRMIQRNDFYEVVERDGPGWKFLKRCKDRN